jgi:hypothetical protein
MLKNPCFETWGICFLQIFETMPGSLKDENKFFKKELGWVFQNFHT